MQGQSPKGLRDPRGLGLKFNLAEHGGRIVAAPAEVERVVARLPATAAPTPAPDVQAAIRVAEDDSEGKDEAREPLLVHFPVVRHQVVFDGGIDDIRVNRRHVGDGGAQLVT